MIRINNLIPLATIVLCGLLQLGAADEGSWTTPVEVRHDETLCLSYSARMDGPYLIVKAKIEPGWHTFSLDNKERVEEKLAGKKALGIDQPTRITLANGIAPESRWLQSNPKDFSKPELRWFSFGFENEATFAVKVKRTGGGEAKLGIRGQACSDTTCKNIDVSITLPLRAQISSAPDTELKGLIEAR